MTRHILFIIGSLFLMSVLLGACGGAPTTATPTAEAVQAKNTNLSTAAEGNLEPVQSVTLNFTDSGLATKVNVTEVNVKEGQAVKAGDVIARLKSDGQRAALAEAEAALAAAQANQAAYRSQLPQLIAAAAADVKAAQAQQAGAAAGRDHQAEIVDAEAALAQAQFNQQRYQTSVDIMYEYNRTGGSLFSKVQLAYENAAKATQAAEARLKALQSGSPGDRAQGAQFGAAQASEAAANARLAQLTAERDGTAADSFEGAIQQAQAAIDSAKVALAQTELRAPFAGTIAELNLKAGELPPRDQPAVTLADLSGWRIETDDVTEIKVPDIKVGQGVTIRFDALPDAELKGEVEAISAVSQVKSGDVVYPVKIKVLDTDPRLRWGMTAAVTFEK
jgi:HlyD family secretion protein